MEDVSKRRHSDDLGVGFRCNDGNALKNFVELGFKSDIKLTSLYTEKSEYV